MWHIGLFHNDDSIKVIYKYLNDNWIIVYFSGECYKLMNILNWSRVLHFHVLKFGTSFPRPVVNPSVGVVLISIPRPLNTRL